MSTRAACLQFLIVVIAIGICAAGYFFYARHESMKRHCQENVAQIGAALQAYAGQHQGHYPKDLQSLKPPPTVACYVAEAGYDKNYQVSSDGMSCSVCCKGDLHGLGPDQPAWRSP